jgi:hypothetical protein
MTVQLFSTCVHAVNPCMLSIFTDHETSFSFHTHGELATHLALFAVCVHCKASSVHVVNFHISRIDNMHGSGEELDRHE